MFIVSGFTLDYQKICGTFKLELLEVTCLLGLN